MPGASTRYQAFQLQLQRPFVGGYNFLLGYNYNRGRSMEFFDDVVIHERRIKLWLNDNQRAHRRNSALLCCLYQLRDAVSYASVSRAALLIASVAIVDIGWTIY